MEVFIPCGGIRLEGRLEEAAGPRAALIAHPHPLYGGDMDNPVVVALARAFREAGYSVLRFNFRGVGRSEGAHGGGGPEREDLAAAREWLRGRGAVEILGAGYSFGARVLAGAPEGFSGLLLVSPPVALLDFGAPAPLPALRLVVTARPLPGRPSTLRANPRALPRRELPAEQLLQARERSLPGRLLAHHQGDDHVLFDAHLEGDLPAARLEDRLRPARGRKAENLAVEIGAHLGREPDLAHRFPPSPAPLAQVSSRSRSSQASASGPEKQ